MFLVNSLTAHDFIVEMAMKRPCAGISMGILQLECPKIH